jgi:hypothetical protein
MPKRDTFSRFLRLHARFCREIGHGRSADNTYRLAGKLLEVMAR